MVRDLDTEYRDQLASEIKRAEDDLRRLRELHNRVCDRISLRNGVVTLAARVAAVARDGGKAAAARAAAQNATQRVLAAFEEAGVPLLSSEVRARVPGIPEPTVRSVLFHQTVEGTLVKTGRRPFRWSLRRHIGAVADGEDTA